MGEPKPIASLSSLLLARKGAARPAMRRPASFSYQGEAPAIQEDLGWNDMGYDVNPDPSTPMDHDHSHFGNPLAGAVPEVNPEVREQQEIVAQRLREQAEVGFESFNQGEVADHSEDGHSEDGAAGSIEPASQVSTRAWIGTASAIPAPLDLGAAAQAAQPPETRKSAKSPATRAQPGAKDKAAFTLRLDKDRHLKLRLACAVSNRSAQAIVTEALDAFIENIPEIGQLAARVPNR